MNIVIFGITGDLANKKLLPSIKALKDKGLLPEKTRIIGFARSKKPEVDIVGDYSSLEDIYRLKEIIKEGDEALFYFAVPPNVYSDLLLNIGKGGLIKKGNSHKKILIEKPFGTNKNDALKLFEIIDEYFDSSQIYPIDHYGGKFEIRESKVVDPLTISNLEVSIYEQLDVSNRAGFYDLVGAINDIGQNHLLYMLAMTLNKNKRTEIIKNLNILPGTLIIGQYEGFKFEKGVRENSKTETFFRVKGKINLENYKHMDISLSGGKALGVGHSKINNVKLSSGTSAYENIFLDALKNKRETFLSKEEILACWEFSEKIKKEAMNTKLIIYPKGSLPEAISFGINKV